MRLTAVAVAVLAGLAASATDYCVGSVAPAGVTCTDVGGDEPSDQLTAALRRADGATTATAIYIAEDTYRGQYGYSGTAPLELVGSGPETIIESDVGGETPVFTASSPVTVRALTMQEAGATEDVLDLPAGGRVEDVRLVGGGTGLRIRRGTVRRVEVAGAAVGVSALPVAAGTEGLRLLDSRIRGSESAVTTPVESVVAIERSVLEATGAGYSVGLRNLGTEVDVRDSVLRARGTREGALASSTECVNGNGYTRVRFSTVVAASQPGVVASCNRTNQRAETIFVGSILAPGVRVGTSASRGGFATVALQRTRWDGDAAGASVEDEGGVRTEDPRFVSDEDLRLRRDSPLVDIGDQRDRGNEGLLGDVTGSLRVADGDGDGTARVDLGAHETVPAPGPSTAGNLLVNGGAEGATNDTPDGWTSTVGTLRSFRYAGFGDGDDNPYVIAPITRAFGAGERLFVPNSEDPATATQTTDLTERTAAIDGPGTVATLSGLLGSFFDADDPATVTTTFLGAGGETLGTLTIGPVTAAQRGAVTALARRTATARVPAGTRRAITTLTLDAEAGGLFADSFADELSLTLADDPAPVDSGGGGGGGGATPGGGAPGGGVPAPGGAGSAPPAGGTAPLVTYVGPVLPGGRLRLDAKGRVAVPVACPATAVGGCVGRLELRRSTGRKAKAARTVRLARAKVAVAAGTTKTVRLKLSRKARRGLRKTTKLTLKLVTRDGQPGARDVTRTTTVRLAPAKR